MLLVRAFGYLIKVEKIIVQQRASVYIVTYSIVRVLMLIHLLTDIIWTAVPLSGVPLSAYNFYEETTTHDKKGSCRAAAALISH